MQRGRKPEIVQVIASYKATSAEQLDLQKGQLIMIRKKTESGWWEGELQVIFFKILHLLVVELFYYNLVVFCLS